MYLHSIFKKVSIENHFENTITECLLKPLLLYVDRLPIATELYEIYFICIRHIRKDATYGDLLPEDKQMTLFQDAIKDRLIFLYNAVYKKRRQSGTLPSKMEQVNIQRSKDNSLLKPDEKQQL